MRLPLLRLMFPLMLQAPRSRDETRWSSRWAVCRRSPRRQSQGWTNSPRQSPRRAAFAANSCSTYAREYRRYASAHPSRTSQALISLAPWRHTATMRPSRSRSSQPTERPSIWRARAWVARRPQGQRRFPARQLCRPSGASMPQRRIRTESISIVSPSSTRAIPDRSARNVSGVPLWTRTRTSSTVGSTRSVVRFMTDRKTAVTLSRECSITSSVRTRTVLGIATNSASAPRNTAIGTRNHFTGSIARCVVRGRVEQRVRREARGGISQSGQSGGVRRVPPVRPHADK